MNCHDFQAKAVDLASNKVPAGDRGLLLRHAEVCRECADLLDGQRDLGFLLASVADSDRSSEPNPRIENLLAERVRSRGRSVPWGPDASSAARSRAARWPGVLPPNGSSFVSFGGLRLAMAAAVVVAVAMAAAWSRWSQAPRLAVPRIEAGSSASLSQPPLALPPVSPTPGVSTTGRPGGKADRPASSSVAHAGPTRTRRPVSRAGAPLAPAAVPSREAPEVEMAGDFLPVGGPDLPPLESAQVLRVRVPRDILLSFGFPMNPERGREPVQADILVGQDGMTRAIRFVR